MISNIEEKFRSGAPLDENDRRELELAILNETAISIIQSSIYIYGKEFPKRGNIAQKAKEFIFENKIPGLTATSLKVLVDFWGDRGECLSEMQKYLDYSVYNEWYDEVIVSASFFSRHRELRTNDINNKLLSLTEEARRNRDDYLSDLIDGA